MFDNQEIRLRVALALLWRQLLFTLRLLGLLVSRSGFLGHALPFGCELQP
jgi:hypothetical protein